MPAPHNAALSRPEAEKIIATPLAVHDFYDLLRGIGVKIQRSPFNPDLMILRSNDWKVYLNGYQDDEALSSEDVAFLLRRLGLLDDDGAPVGPPH